MATPTQRPLKFRAWDKERKEMVSDYWIDKFTLQQLQDNPRFIFLQYTGQTDKNDEEIYDGSILKTKDGVQQVVWDGQQWGLSPQGKSNSFGVIGQNRKEEQEVLGNVFEHPTLLSSTLEPPRG